MNVADARILHLFANYKWTGPADPAIRAAARLRALGLDVVFAQGVVTHRGGEHRIAEELARAGVPVVAGMELRKHFHPASLLRDVRALRRLLARDRYDVLHCHLPADHLIAALAVRGMARPPVIVRSLYDPDAPKPGLRARYAFRRTAGVLAPTQAAARGVVARFRLPPDRVLWQEPVTEPRRVDGPDLRAAWGLDASHRVVGITARVQPHRRFDLLWATARAVVDALPNARFVLLGKGLPAHLEEHVHAPVRALGLQREVVVPGYQRGADYEKALRSLDAFLFLVPGSDGTCRAVCDAMAFGRPVVATRAGILPELLASRRAGEIPGHACDDTPQALAAALLAYLRDDALAARDGAAALRRATIDMDPVRAAQRCAGLYQELLSARAASTP
jgi:glycosyltransferase involved in cell wall biosynthesis